MSRSLNLINAKYLDFRNVKTSFCKNFLVPGEMDIRNVYVRVCRNKTGVQCFFFSVSLICLCCVKRFSGKGFRNGSNAWNGDNKKLPAQSWRLKKPLLQSGDK